MIIARNQAPLLGFVITLALLCWGILVWLVIDMCNPIAMMTMPMSPSWLSVNFVAVFFMWAIMMAAMMLPSAIPMILLHHKMSGAGNLGTNTALFIAAYLVIWSLFSIVAVIVQFLVHNLGLLNPSSLTVNSLVSGAVLILAGGFQFTKLKETCLRACQSPAGFFMSRWKGGAKGSFSMGLSHGMFCLGCCWALMLLLFVGGVMNLAWVLLLTVGVLAEKTIPAGKTLSNLIGAILIFFGCYSIYGYFVTDGKAPLKMMAMECMKMDDMKMDKMGTD
jgi:predicted metal-binding membrane protein